MNIPFQLVQFQPQMALPEIGLAGQQKLQAARVLCVGLGGLAATILPYLAAAGVGHLGLVDGDVVAEHNLHRQLLYRLSDVGQFKSQVAKRYLQEIWSALQIEEFCTEFNEGNAMSLIQTYDIVIDASDNFSTHLLINDSCCLAQKKFVLGAVSRYAGFCMTCVAPSPCLRCFLGQEIPGMPTSCSEEGVLGMVPAMIGLCQAIEVVKLILNVGESLSGKILWFDALTSSFKKYQLTADPTCPLCAQKLAFNILTRPQRTTCMAMTQNEINYEELCEIRTSKPDTILIDVRMPEEHMRENIGGICIPLPEIASILENPKIANDFNQTIIVYCQKGIRSRMAQEELIALGFKNVLTLKHGVSALIV